MKNCWLRCLLVLFFSFAFGFFLWIPFVFDAEVNWDESSFILVADDILRGHLPYIRLWDLKSPLAFFIPSIFLAISKSIVFLRLCSIFMIALTAVGIYRLSSLILPVSLALGSALLFVLFSSVAPGSPCLLSEHMVNLSLVLALLFAVHGKDMNESATGLFIGIATMTRINIGYLAVGLVLYLILAGFRSRNKTFGVLAKFSIAALLPTVVLGLIYFRAGFFEVFFNSAIRAPLAYSELGPNLLSGLAGVLERGFYLDIFTLWLMFFIGLVFFIKNWSCLSQGKKKYLKISLVFWMSVLLSMSGSKEFFSHYVVQLLGLMIPIGVYGSWQIFLSHRGKWLLVPIVIIGIILPLQKPLDKSIRELQSWARNGSFEKDAATKIADYLRINLKNNESFLMLHHHIVYHLLDVPPFDKLVHPSNLARDRLFPYVYGQKMQTVEVLKKIFGRKPAFIVAKMPIPYLKNSQKAKEYLDSVLEKYYFPVEIIEGATIFERLKHQG